MIDACRLRRAERYKACVDDMPFDCLSLRGVRGLGKGFGLIQYSILAYDNHTVFKRSCIAFRTIILHKLHCLILIATALYDCIMCIMLHIKASLRAGKCTTVDLHLCTAVGNGNVIVRNDFAAVNRCNTG